MEYEQDRNAHIVLSRKESSFRNRISEYILQNVEHVDPKLFLNDAFILFREETIKLLSEHSTIKTHTSLQIRFVKQNVNENGEVHEQKMDRHFNTKSSIITQTTDLRDYYQSTIVEKIINKISDFQLMGSGWSIDAIIGLTINNCKLECFNGSSYMKLPKFIETKKAIINIQNFNDNKCFLWSVLAAIHHKEIKKNLHRVNNYKKYESELNMTNMRYPVTIQQIDLFEKQNPTISINVYMYAAMKGKDNYRKKKIYPVRLTKEVKLKHVHLLLTSKALNEDAEEDCDFSDDENYADVYDADNDNFSFIVGGKISEGLDTCDVNFHYTFIKDLGRLLQSQLSAENRRKKYYCDRCLNYFYTEEKLFKHSERCSRMNFTRITLHSHDEKWIEFKNFKHKLEVPFTIYENEILDDLPKGAYQKHIPHSVGYFFQSKHPDLIESFYSSYNGLDCMEWFVNELKQIAKKVYPILKTVIEMKALSAEQANQFTFNWRISRSCASALQFELSRAKYCTSCIS